MNANRVRIQGSFSQPCVLRRLVGGRIADGQQRRKKVFGLEEIIWVKTSDRN
jgi:hypothetical protein